MSSTESPKVTQGFADLGLSDLLVKTLTDIGYESPSPIQAECIPILLEGKDIIGQAQTGTGKTAAFALPLMEQIDVKLTKPQALVLTPTRELAIQVAEALQSYAKNLPGFHVLPIYGGQSYTIQLKQLARGAHIVVGTPGRVMDHLERKTLNLDNLKTYNKGNLVDAINEARQSGGGSGGGGIQSAQIDAILVMTKSEYDALDKKDARTLYLLEG